MRLITFAFLAFSVLSFSAATAAELEKNIMTGGPKGTYIQIGRNISDVLKTCGQTLNVVESAGSLENFAGVRNRKNTQFGIVQSDLLEYLKTFEANDADVQKAVKGVRIMFPLYNEEVHVLAKSDVASLKDLSGRKIAVGKTDSGTYLTSSLMLDILQVKGGDRLTINPDEALPKLLNGEIDAMFYVAGAPTAIFKTDTIDGAKFHLLPITEAPLLATYVKSTIPAGTYPFHQDPLDVVAVKAVMMTFEYDPKKNAYHKQSCAAVADISSLILSNLDQLQATGHPKWRTVDLTALPPGWQVANCVKIGMAADFKPACTASAAPQSQAPANDNADYLNLLKQRLKK